MTNTNKMTNKQQADWPAESGEAEEQTLMSQAAANNNIHNSQWLVDGIANQGAESAVFCWSKAAAPEVLGMAGQFPVGQGIAWQSSFPMNHASGSRNMQVCQTYYQTMQTGKFPLYLKSRSNQGFPLFFFKHQKEAENHTILDETQLFSPHHVYAPCTARFPIHQVYAPWQMNFPKLLQLPRKNSDGHFPEVSTTMTRRGQVASSHAEQASQEFPIIKKRFVSFPNYRAMPEDGPEYPHPQPPTAATTTMTQPGLDKVTEIDKIDEIDVGGEGGGGAGVHKVPPMLDNEPEAEEQTAAAEALSFALNLNVAREIEHQQAENLNDAFGQRRHDHKNDDAMDGAKNKREICEQSKLEKAEDHNEPNMRDREQQSICLAREQTIDANGQQHHHHHRQQQQQHQNQNLNRNTNHQQYGDLSDARESSPEQVDVDLGRLLTRERNPNPNPNPNPNANRSRPNIELLKSSVRAFLTERNWDWDWELLDLLTDAIEVICAHPETGNLWSEAAAGADMTVSKVSEERETDTVVEVYPAEQLLDQPTEQADDNNNTSATEQQPSEMKYELKTPSPSLPSRSPRPESPVTRLGATSRSIRNVEPSAPATHDPLLGDIKRTSISRDSTSSIDVDSVLPERTRLRRQRRVRSQDSVEEKPEDVIERLNKLKARISGALSEVKGVLKQYSTESEAESAAEQTQSTPAEDQAAPVSFRFVKKVRRRSYFDEAEEEKEQAGEELINASNDTKVQREQTPFARELLEDSAERDAQTNGKQQLNASKETKTSEKDFKEVIEVSKKEKKNDIQESKELENQDGKLPKDQDYLDVKPPMESKEYSEALAVKLVEDVSKSHANESRDPKISEVKGEEPKMNGQLPKTAEQVKQPEKSKTQAKIEFLAKVQSELKSKSVKDVTPKEQTTKEETHKGLSPKREATTKESEPRGTTEVDKSNDVSVIKPSEPDESPTSPPASKTKKKVIVKVKNPRRASIAAVEPSKIKVEPAVEQSDVLITQRRPSDSEAIVKRKKKLKLMGDTAAPSTSTCTSPRSASSTTKDCIGIARETASIAEEKETATSEQLAMPKVTAVPAKLPSAKSGQETAATAAPVVVAAATPATTATPAAKSKIDADPAIGNLAPAGERTRRASLKLAELVGETVLVVPAATAAPQDPLPESKEPIIDQEALVPATPQQVAIGADIAPQIAATLVHEESSPEQQSQSSAEATKAGEQPPPGDSLATMPELKVLAGPVQPVKIETVEQPHDAAKNQESLVKKKPTHLKKLVRKNSIDKETEKQEKNDSSKLSNILRDRNKINELSSRINKLTPPKKQAKPKEEAKKATTANEDSAKPEEATAAEETTTETQALEEVEPEPEVEPAPEPKKPRKIKKKVIIKRQKRRLSVGDTFFLQPEPEEPAIPEVETIERAIAYVTDDEEDPKAPAEEPEPVNELKSCLHVREYKIGDLVLYAERYRKTQVRWKRGRVLERITSISYKLEIEGKEVPAHVSYIKKYTGRKVRFGTKEYLEIDYEQVAEEERRAASYSIWNMV